ncbi:response regulator [Pseudodesulfovibrio sp.]|uniref:response regulator n=1 Tax=Pseudodesulfovibrio sp. TaxID=2035812 RepID=UPI002632F84B|nr:response regulator [Pseudodesulfovibrio sp.]MDD3311640.1 tetratricopeptide repeat protein [Pseudodesulfovibrio sp.]
MADKKYDSIVYDYFEKKGGVVVLISEDQLFKRTLAATILKTIGSKRDCLSAFENVELGLKKLRDFRKANIDCTVFIERMLGGRPSTDTIITIKRLLPDLKVIVLVGETRRENIAYFYEIGVNNVISKPASMNNIIEKLAFTIKPQGKLSELMGLGQRLLAAGKFKETLAICDKILSLKDNSPAGLMLRGDVLLEQGDRQGAIDCYLKAHDSSRLYLEPLKKLAAAYEGVDEEQRLNYLKKLDKLSPLNTERKTDIGTVYLKQKKMDIAEKYFDQAIEAATREAMTHVGQVAERISEAVGHASPSMAEKYLAKVIETRGSALNKDDITLFNKLGIALRGQGKWREAIDNYARALVISPNDEGLHYNMAMAWFDGGDLREAARCVEKALKINPRFYEESVPASVNLGTIFSDLRRPGEALPFFENALRLNPGHELARSKVEALRRGRG